MRKHLTLILLLLLVLSLALLTAACGDQPFRQQTATEAAEFKADYEALNEVLGEDGQPRYSYLELPADNPVVTLSYDEVMEFLDSGSGLLYIGRPGCPWCRLLLPTLLQFAGDKETYLYYYDVEAIRDANNDQYKALVERLYDFLPQDTVTQKEGEADFNPDLRRVVLPHLFFLDQGEIKSDLMAYRHPYLEEATANPQAMYDLLAEKYLVIEQ